MNKITLDGAEMLTRKIAHQYLKEQFGFPEYYGENLDALWDMLSIVSKPMVIRLENNNMLQENLGAYGQAIIAVFMDLASENKNIVFHTEADKNCIER